CCLLLLSIRVPAASSLFPYTTLFRSPLHRRLLSAHQSLWIEHLRLPARKGSLKRLFPEAFESHPAGCRTLCGDFPVFSHTPRREPEAYHDSNLSLNRYAQSAWKRIRRLLFPFWSRERNTIPRHNRNLPCRDRTWCPGRHIHRF